MLAMRAGRSVSIQELIAALWGNEPPDTAVQTLRTYVSHLRRVLPDGAIDTTESGYRIHVDSDGVDALRFGRIVDEGRRLLERGLMEAAVVQLREAIDLWRGDPLTDLARQPSGRAEATRLLELLYGAEDILAEARLALGDHAALVPELERAVAAEPLRERRWAQLMRALYHTGRQAEALEAYRRLRQHLADELAIEPALDLRMLERAILRQELHAQPISAPDSWSMRLGTEGIFPSGEGEATPFVGRDAERAALQGMMERALAGQGGVVVVGGEPGVGKTRLGEEIAAAGRLLGFDVFTGHCYQRGGDLPYMPWVEILERAVAETLPASLLEALGDAAPEIARIAPQLRRLCPEIPAPLDMPPEQQRRYTFASIANYAMRVAAAHPQLYIIEDLHWADEATLLFLEYLADRLAGARVLVLGTYRDPPIDISKCLEETLVGLVRRPHARLLSLKRHSKPEVESMLRGLAGQQPPEGVVTAIFGETEGNAFLVEEVFHHLAETGALLDERGRFYPNLRTVELDVPENVRLVTDHRLDRLGESTRRMLMVAAVVGRRFGFELLTTVADLGEEALLDAIDEAARARLIVPDRGVQGSFWFSHELIRQAILTRLSAPRRQRSHRRIADALERLYTDDIGLHAADIAQHLMGAGTAAKPERTVQYLAIAGKQAMSATAFEQALEHFKSAMPLASTLEPHEMAELLFHLGMAQRACGHWDDALCTWRQSLDRFESLGDSMAVGRVCLEAGFNLAWATRFGEAIEIYQRGLAALGDAPSADRARLLARASAPLSFGGELAIGDVMLEEALRLAANLDDDTLEPFVLAEMSCARHASMRVSDAVSAGLRAAASLRAAGDLWAAATPLGFVEVNLVHLGRFEESMKVGRDVAVLGERFGNLPALYLHGGGQGMREFFARANLDRLETFGRWHLDFGQRTGLPWTGHSYAWLGLAEFLRGDWENALTLFQRGAVNAPPGALGGFCRALLFHCQVYLRDRSQALALFEERSAELPRLGQPNMWGSWAQLMAFTEGLYILDRREEAAAFYPLITEAKSTGAIITSYHEGRLLERVAGISASAGGHWTIAEEHYRTALRQADELPHQLEQLETRRFYAQMLTERGAPGDDVHATQLLGEATIGYVRLGMPRHAQLARTQ